MTDPITRLNAALEGRYAIERELGEGGMATVYRSSADVLEWRELPNTESGNHATFSPNGEWVAFQRGGLGGGGGIFKVPITGGPALPVADPGFHPHWGANDTIVFQMGGNLHVAPGSGGEAEMLFESAVLSPLASYAP